MDQPSKRTKNQTKNQRASSRPKPPAAMDHRTVLTLLLLLVAQAACKSLPAPNMTRAINELQKDINTTLGKMDKTLTLPNLPCDSLNVTEEVVVKKDLSFSENLSSFRCLLLELANAGGFSPDLQAQLRNFSQRMQCVEVHFSPTNQPGTQTCVLTLPDQDPELNKYLECLLKIQQTWLSKQKP